MEAKDKRGEEEQGNHLYILTSDCPPPVARGTYERVGKDFDAQSLNLRSVWPETSFSEFDNNNYLRELPVYERHPGDGCVKVGSERKLASSQKAREPQCRRDWLYNSKDFAREGPPKFALMLWWGFSLKSYSFSHANQILGRNQTHSCILAVSLS